MSDFIDVQDIAIRNRIAVDGRVNPTVEDWNNLLTHIDRLEQENAELRSVLDRYKARECRQDIADIKEMTGMYGGLDKETGCEEIKALHKEVAQLREALEKSNFAFKANLARTFVKCEQSMLEALERNNRLLNK